MFRYTINEFVQDYCENIRILFAYGMILIVLALIVLNLLGKYLGKSSIAVFDVHGLISVMCVPLCPKVSIFSTCNLSIIKCTIVTWFIYVSNGCVEFVGFKIGD